MSGKNKLQNLRFYLLYAAAPVFFFSYYPLILLGRSDSMNFELSLPLIWLVAYDFVSLLAFIPLLKKYGFKKSLHGLSDSKFFLLSLFPLFSTASILWSSNPTRAVLTTGLIWALFIAIFATYELLVIECCKNYNTFWRKFKKILYISTTIVCIFCWLQCFLDLAGVPENCTLLCQGCTYGNFGFPRATGFAIEPQFMGNLLLAPIFFLLFDIFKSPKSPRKLALFTFFCATLFLTFSRGAIYAFAAALLFALVLRSIKTKTLTALIPLALAIVAFIFTLFSQGLMAEFSPTNDTFITGVTKSIHHLTLGKIDFRPVENSAEIVENPVDNSVEKPVENSDFSGYVAESTEIRISLNNYALNIWQKSPANFLFGVGIGAAGTALHANYPAVFSSKEIIQNEYLSLALETGLVGLALIVIAAVMIFLKLRTRAGPKRLLFYTLALAYAISLCFFSGLPNALHVYFFLALALINVII